MIDRVIIDIDDSVQASFSSDVSIVTTDHRILKESTSVALGAPTNPLTQDALIEKFMVLARYALSDEQSLRLAVTLQNLDTLEDSADMLRLLEPTEY
jgi:2-methylcitrate dehydratase PrpD